MPPRKLMLLMVVSLVAGIGGPVLALKLLGGSSRPAEIAPEAPPVASAAISPPLPAPVEEPEPVTVYVDGYAVDQKGFVVVWLSDGRRINWQRISKVTDEFVVLADGSRFGFRPKPPREAAPRKAEMLSFPAGFSS